MGSCSRRSRCYDRTPIGRADAFDHDDLTPRWQRQSASLVVLRDGRRNARFLAPGFHPGATDGLGYAEVDAQVVLESGTGGDERARSSGPAEEAVLFERTQRVAESGTRDAELCREGGLGGKPRAGPQLARGDPVGEHVANACR